MRKKIKRENPIVHNAKCKMCGREMVLHFKVWENYYLYKCPYCSFEQIWMDDDTERTIYTADYFENSKYKDTVALNLEHKRRLGILLKYVLKDERIMDYGCASGEFVNYAGREFEIYGCDVSSDAIESAKERFSQYKNRFYTTKELAKSAEHFSCICLWDVIEHIEYPNELIRNLRKMLKEDGLMILSTPDVGAFFSKITRAHWPFMTPPEHLCFFSKKSMYYFARKNGFEICRWFARGKWANLGFLMYKFNKTSSVKIPQRVINAFNKGWLASLRMYVPTHDVQYVVLRKNKR